jgi:hypothetical protein
MKATRNRSIVVIVAVILSLLTICLPYTPQSPVSANAPKLTLSKNDSPIGIEAKTVERRSLSGELLSRLQINPKSHLGEADFSLEGIQPYTRAKIAAVGKVRISEQALRVQIKDVRSGAEVGMKLRVNMATSKPTRATLWLNQTSYRFTIDLAKARELAKEAQRLNNDARRAEATQLMAEIADTLSPRKNYLSFTERVASSLASDAISIVASVMTTVSKEEFSRDAVLSAIGSAVKIFAPWASGSFELNQAAGRTAAGISKLLIVKAGYTRSHLYRNPLPSPQIDCGACVDAFNAILDGCINVDMLCDVQTGGSGWCDLFLYSCFTGDIALVIWCLRNCG